MRLRMLLGLGCLLGSLVSCAKGGEFVGTGGSATTGGSGGDGGGAGQPATTSAGGGGAGGMASTGSATTSTMPVCDETPCKLVAPQCGCPDGEMCAINGTGVTECHSPPGTKQVDEECTGLYSCVPGALCTLVSSSTSICTAYCDSDAQCGGGLCLIQLNDPQNPGSVLPGVTLCSDDCDPVTGVGCPGGLGLGCQLGQQQDGAMQVFTVCNGSGNGGQGSTCTNNESCLPGYGCFNVGGTNECLQYCKPPNGLCSGGATCLSFDPQLFYKGVEYGACL